MSFSLSWSEVIKNYYKQIYYFFHTLSKPYWNIIIIYSNSLHVYVYTSELQKWDGHVYPHFISEDGYLAEQGKSWIQYLGQ